SPEMNSSGPRSALVVSTLASVQGLRLAVAAWKRGLPDAGTAKLSYSSFASSSLTALAKAYRNCSYVSGTARLMLAGLPSTGEADFSADNGRGSTPRNGAGSIATVAAERPRPATICASRPPKECPITAGFFRSRPIARVKCSATWPTPLFCEDVGMRLRLSHGRGVMRPHRLHG